MYLFSYNRLSSALSSNDLMFQDSEIRAKNKMAGISDAEL
jgi:hypothetical protein